MQWPPTSPGEKSRKFHFVLAAFKTWVVSILSILKSIDNSLISAMNNGRIRLNFRPIYVFYLGDFSNG